MHLLSVWNPAYADDALNAHASLLRPWSARRSPRTIGMLEYLAAGMTEGQILADFPELTAEDIRACLAFAADRERKMVSIPAA